MEKDKEKIDFLKKVTLVLEFGPDKTGSSRDPLPFEFIYGIGPGGLCPFECALADKGAGDAFCIRLERGEIPTYFEHFARAFIDFGGAGAFLARGRVIRVVPADQREVIRAMAEFADCGDHCCGH